MSQKIFTHSEANEIFKFRCNVKWQELYTNQATANTRYCHSCQRNVHLCLNEQDVLEHAKLGNCIAIAAEIPESERLKYESLDKLNESLYGIESGEPLPQPFGKVYFERDDGLKLFAFYRNSWNSSKWATSSHFMHSPPELFYTYNLWQSTNNVVKKLLLDEESLASCFNQNMIYMLKELLTWIDEAIAYGSTWRLYCDDLSLFEKISADQCYLRSQNPLPFKIAINQPITITYLLKSDMDISAIKITKYYENSRGFLENYTKSNFDVSLNIAQDNLLNINIIINDCSDQEDCLYLEVLIPYLDPNMKNRNCIIQIKFILSS